MSLVSITLTTAQIRIRNGQNIYSFNGSSARTAVAGVGLGIIGPEIDANRKKGSVYYYHYHTTKNQAHAWYGNPVFG